MDQVLLATNYQDIKSYRTWAEKQGVGLELQAFADPEVLDHSWTTVLQEHKRFLHHFKGNLGLHGAFYDMVSASLDPAIVEITRHRYRQNLHAAVELDAQYIVFHVNYMGILKLPNYRPGWHRRQVDFWGKFANEAARYGVYLLLENLWEDDPTLISDILTEVNHPYLRTCFDLAHATLFSKQSIASWLEHLEPYLHCCHLNNHDGELDQHWPLGRGVIDYAAILPRLRKLDSPPLMTLEMPTASRIKASLPFLELAGQPVKH